MGTVSYAMTQRAAAEFVSRLSRSHGLQLQRFLLRMLGRRDIAEDIAQDAYLKIYRLSRPDEVTCPQALLFDVATKLALTRIRRARAEAAITAAADAEEVEQVADAAAGRPDQRAAVSQAMQQLAEIIEDLAPNLRQVFVMRYVKQMPRQEIAEQLNISLGALEQRLTRALAQCRARMSALGLDWLGLD
jgi:RNA polymerase sigma factor (sigma-70 family)